MQIDDARIAIIGLGYVGLPLAVEFGKLFNVKGYDLNPQRIEELNNNIDNTFEMESNEISSSKVCFTSNKNELVDCNTFIVTVPTPINENNEPDLIPLKNATETISGVIKKGDIVIYESTVYPGATEEFCIPIIEEISGLKYNQDFFAGYSPERINPGDKEHRLPAIIKITSGSNNKAAEYVDSLYSKIIKAGTHKAESIKVAEAAKVIENTQRDLNIALINELAIIFNKLDIDTEEVLKAAGTKWNFLNFRPGLVGGHCIGVDPYYLTHKSQSIGYDPQIILAGRRLNDQMGSYVAKRLIKKMSSKKINVQKSKILIMGYTFKENCPDIRNTRVKDIVSELAKNSIETKIYDPWVSDRDRKSDCNVNKFIDQPLEEEYDAVIIAVGHEIFAKNGFDYVKKICKQNHVIFDIKYIFPSEETDLRL